VPPRWDSPEWKAWFDGAKGFAAVVITRALGLPVETQLLSGLAAIAGQMWPVFHGFDGGRANATTWGFQLASDFIAFFIGWIPVIVAAALRISVRPRPKRLLPIANLLSYAVFPAVIWEQEGLTPTVLAGLAALVLIVLRRLTAGIGEDLATGAPAARVILNRPEAYNAQNARMKDLYVDSHLRWRNVPKPTIVAFAPPRSARVMLSKTASTIVIACFFV